MPTMKATEPFLCWKCGTVHPEGTVRTWGPRSKKSVGITGDHPAGQALGLDPGQRQELKESYCDSPLPRMTANELSRMLKQSYSSPPEPPEPVEPEPEPTQNPPRPTSWVGGLVDEVLTRSKDEIQKQVTVAVTDAVNSQLPEKVEIFVTNNGIKREITGHKHQSLQRLTEMLANGLKPYIYGPPGGGKGFAAAQIAKALHGNLDRFYSLSLSPYDTPSRIIGFRRGQDQVNDGTLVTDWIKNGGLLLVDECDNGNPNVLTTLNEMLANGRIEIPGWGMVDLNPECQIIGAGNSPGYGPTDLFPQAIAFTPAFRNRFTYLEWPWDETLERSIALSINPDAAPIVDWVQALRLYAKERLPGLLVGPRSTYGLAQEGKLTKDLIEAHIFKSSVQESDKVAIWRELKW